MLFGPPKLCGSSVNRNKRHLDKKNTKTCISRLDLTIPFPKMRPIKHCLDAHRGHNAIQTEIGSGQSNLSSTRVVPHTFGLSEQNFQLNSNYKAQP